MTSSIKSMLIENYYELKLCSTCTCNLGKLSDLYGCKFSSKNEEIDDPINARLHAREAVGFIRKAVGKGTMTIQYNIRYGFFRNLIAGIIWSAPGSVGCAIYYGIFHEWYFMILFIMYFIIGLLLFVFKKNILEKIAFSYADTLFNEFLFNERGNQ